MKRKTPLWKNEQGLAAIEFAFILPIMLSMLLGLVELSQALMQRADVTNMASTASDLIAEESAANSTDVQNVYSALSAILFPYCVPAGNNACPQAQITISSIVDGGVGKPPKVAWSCTQGGITAAAPPNPMPAGLMTPGDGGSVIWSKVTYNYTSPLHYLLGPMTWESDFYSKPRRVPQIPLSGAIPSCS